MGNARVARNSRRTTLLGDLPRHELYHHTPTHMPAPWKHSTTLCMEHTLVQNTTPCVGAHCLPEDSSPLRSSCTFPFRTYREFPSRNQLGLPGSLRAFPTAFPSSPAEHPWPCSPAACSHTLSSHSAVQGTNAKFLQRAFVPAGTGLCLPFRASHAFRPESSGFFPHSLSSDHQFPTPKRLLQVLPMLLPSPLPAP